MGSGELIRLVLVGLVVANCLLFGFAGARRKARQNRTRQTAEQPMQTIELQLRLSELAAEVQRLERGDEWARGHHLRAAETAYDYLLAEACARAGVAEELAAAAKLRAAKPARLDMELALSERGWNW